jgi:hypothetical protein
MIPEQIAGIYPNPIQYLYWKPVFVFRDHRWTLPILFVSGKQSIITLPVNLIMFDRHRDSLFPCNGTGPLTGFRDSDGSVEDLFHIVRNHLSPRDDDWILSGMELGLITDVVQFGVRGADAAHETITKYTDSHNIVHRVFHLGRPCQELSFKGALADTAHELVPEGLWEVFSWNPSVPGITENGKEFILDIDLDYFTFSWDRYTFAFNDEIYEGEFFSSCQSSFYDDYIPLEFIRELIRKSVLITLVTEPAFCGGSQKAQTILENINDLFFEKELNVKSLRVDYPIDYPDE